MYVWTDNAYDGWECEEPATFDGRGKIGGGLRGAACPCGSGVVPRWEVVV
jgi:hypothetical protein